MNNFWDNMFVQVSYLLRAILFVALFVIAADLLRKHPLDTRWATWTIMFLCYALALVNAAITLEWFYNIYR